MTQNCSKGCWRKMQIKINPSSTNSDNRSPSFSGGYRETSLDSELSDQESLVWNLVVKYRTDGDKFPLHIRQLPFLRRVCTCRCAGARTSAPEANRATDSCRPDNRRILYRHLRWHRLRVFAFHARQYSCQDGSVHRRSHPLPTNWLGRVRPSEWHVQR